MKKKGMLLSLCLLAGATGILSAQDVSQQLPAWQEGMLDIHTISTGRGNCQFFVLPDGTTMMIDAGDFDGDEYNRKYAPMRCAPILPDSTMTSAQAIANYINNLQGNFDKPIDYFLMTHFHTDHYGCVRPGLPVDAEGGYALTGLTELYGYLPFRRLVDRAYPDYSYPVPLIDRKGDNGESADPSFDNYIHFCRYRAAKDGLERMPFRVGYADEFVLLRHPESYPNFSVQNIKKNDLLWTGTAHDSVSIFSLDELMGPKKRYSENPLSCALVMEYGKFRYYAGGDNSGLLDQDHDTWCDLESRMAPVVGRVSAMTLNHHGNRDASNRAFLEALDPIVVLSQSWSSDHPGQEVAHRLISPNLGSHKREIYMTCFDPLTGLGIGPWFERELTGYDCHTVIRVYPDSSFETYVLDARRADNHVVSVSERHIVK